VAKKAYATDKTVRQVVLEEDLVSAAQIDELLG
jgi:aspartate ammonia-lyase